MHIWKLPGALDFIRADLGLSLVDSGVLLGIVQVGSMLLGLAACLFSEIWGLRLTLVVGMVLLAVGSLAGAFATAVLTRHRLPRTVRASAARAASSASAG